MLQEYNLDIRNRVWPRVLEYMRRHVFLQANPSVSPCSMTSSVNHTCDPVVPSVNPFFMLVYSLLFLQASSSLMVYLKNLTAADFLLCLCLPLRITHYASSSAILHRVHCSIGATSLYLNMYTSILFMGYIAVNRYLKIIHPLGTHILQTVRTAHIVSTVTWVFLLAPTITYNIMFFKTHKPLTSQSGYCGPLFSTSFSVLHKTFQISCTIIFLLVFISLVFFYYSTSRRVLQAQQRQLASSGSEKLVKSRRNILVLVSIFCVCFVPYHLVRLPYAFLWKSSVGQLLYYLKEAATMVSVFNVCLDPLVYFFLCKTFRAHVRKASWRVNDPNKQTRRVRAATSQTNEL
ncbi:P2Y purinoceptor 14 isoform X3 [Oreochromis niloticus]|uniref:P2Y purinoceptor 14 isoform X3 n=2 Tax=Oreochromis niloticus TaxID=8128 RepID=UPI000DF1E7F6|nr:P2Y purinoceptor 14 isoform X3 [Oreochromis niloticus]